MLVFPQLSSGANVQYPLVREVANRTVANLLQDGSMVKFEDVAAGRRRLPRRPWPFAPPVARAAGRGCDTRAPIRRRAATADRPRAARRRESAAHRPAARPAQTQWRRAGFLCPRARRRTRRTSPTARSAAVRLRYCNCPLIPAARTVDSCLPNHVIPALGSSPRTSSCRDPRFAAFRNRDIVCAGMRRPDDVGRTVRHWLGPLVLYQPAEPLTLG